jgi:hypothetical protein
VEGAKKVVKDTGGFFKKLFRKKGDKGEADEEK